MSRLPQPPRRGANNNTNGQSLSNSTVLYLGSIPFDWDENNVRSIVCGTGRVVDVRMGFDYVGKNKGFCFVEYLTSEEIPHALDLLNQIRVSNNGKVKKLRIEQSKEGLRSNASADRKQVLQLDRSHIPANVQLPPELMAGSPMGQPIGQPMGQMGQMPMNMGQNMPMMGGQMNNMQQPMNMNPMNMRNSRNLPIPPSLPFKIPDKINENLSHLPPPQLIELIANLKEMLNGPNANRAPEMFQMSPFLASNAAQALLLMGLIDEEVIQESSKNPQLNSTPQLPQSHYTPPPPPPPPINPPAQQFQTKWPFLPYHTQQKLAQMAPDQADLIAQVLTIPLEQIPSLEPDKQMMVSNLRAQYL